MPDVKSYAEFILGTFRALLVDCARWYPELSKEFDRDFLRLSSAIDSHGIRFALETMPAFRKHLDKCLSEGHLTPSNLLHFGVVRKGEAIPRLFRGLTSRVFDRNGRLKDEPDIVAIRCLRQLLGVVRKLRLEANPKDRGNTVLGFYQVDMGIRRGSLSWDDHESFIAEVDENDTSFVDAVALNQRCDASLCPERGSDSIPIPVRVLYRALANVQRVADLMASALGSFDPHEWVFRHGPGAVADQSFGSSKYCFLRWPDRLETSFPFADFAVANYAQVEPVTVEVLRARGFTHESPARLCAVPKTIKAPRLIASEPVCLQWCQQAVRDYFYSGVSRTFISKFVDFRRQEKNGMLALEASHTGTHSTIDLKDASDRISCWHVERLFRRSPMLLRALQATRSVWLEQSICRYSPRFHKLRKYSTMGNATTFPVQSVLFAALTLAAVFTVRNMRVSFANMRALRDSEVRIFGDDLIVPSDASGLLVGMLGALEMRVNTTKSFLRGKFRESCGVDAYDGHDVTSVSILEVPRKASPSAIESSVDVHNNLFDAGWRETANMVRQAAKLCGFTKIREVKHGDGAFGWHVDGVPDLTGLRTRVNRDRQIREVRCLRQMPISHRVPAEGSPGLLQFFTEAAKVVTSAKSTLGHLDRRPQAKLRLGWVPV